MNKNIIKNNAIRLISRFGDNIQTKLVNVCGKVGSYYVPIELFQKRTARNKRVLIPWKTILNNNITLEQLNTFENGVVVEFLNNDFFDKRNESNKTFRQLKELLGSDDNVSSIISIHSEGGTSSSSVQRICFNQLLNNTKVKYKNNTITINKDNYKDYLIQQNRSGGTGNDTWSGFLYFSIKGGQQDTIESHKNQSLTLFNPACEYANTNVSTDITLVLLYFAYKSITKEDLKVYNICEKVFDDVFDNIKSALKESIYNSSSYNGNLLDYCEKHISCQAESDNLLDPIQLNIISIRDFNTKKRRK